MGSTVNATTPLAPRAPHDVGQRHLSSQGADAADAFSPRTGGTTATGGAVVTDLAAVNGLTSVA
jgi:hypothetical protein